MRRDISRGGCVRGDGVSSVDSTSGRGRTGRPDPAFRRLRLRLLPTCRSNSRISRERAAIAVMAASRSRSGSSGRTRGPCRPSHLRRERTVAAAAAAAHRTQNSVANAAPGASAHHQNDRHHLIRTDCQAGSRRTMAEPLRSYYDQYQIVNETYFGPAPKSESRLPTLLRPLSR